MIRLVEANETHRTLLWNIHQKYLYEMTSFYENEMDGDGIYPYRYFDAYFAEPERKAFLFYMDERLAGFAMVNSHSYIGGRPDYVLAEFTVFPAFRKRRIASLAAEQVFKLYPGQWELKYHEQNEGAKRLWNKVTARYAPQRYDIGDGETVLAFSVSENQA